ncbi:hypothetical protein RhiirA1_460010 [Rhizophagus irregularis]|uniref:Protein kinase domain-containing protein n=1 Tax=Rhizophagus irregularis TaxID=588596 RepID=A0A2N0RSB8_9GLOM|nr:hypothetical protein RhiirA1_460010 [Rhizophagus irregularis]
MSKDTKIKDLNYYIDWLEKSITEEHIELYEYSDFKNIQLIGSGAYGNVYRVNRKYSNRIFALKSFNYEKQTLNEVVKELKLHRSVNYHENIIRLYGITRVEIDTIQKYSFVLEYADSGTLNTYLNENFNKLDWNDKYNLASQLASAIEFLHEKDTIHRDLHGNNILIHQKNIKLADFGLSKKMAEASSNTSKILGVMPYIDPKKLENQNYKLNKKSDVYSIGVLLWQISSGYRPFHELDHDAGLVLAILNGKREEIINGTPVKYSNLYRECWKYEPNERPNIQKIVSALKSITSLEEINTTMINNFIEKKENHLLEIYEANSELSEKTIDLNNELMSNNELNLVEYNTKPNERVNNESKINDSEETDQHISHKIPKSSKVRQESLIDNSGYFSSSTDVTEAIEAVVNNNNTIQNQKYENSLLSASSDQVTKMSIKFIEFINIDSLIAFLIEKHDKGITFEQIQQLISKQILQTNQATDRFVKWLLKNQNQSKYIWFFGLFYYYNILLEKNSSIKAFELFSKAANDNYSIAQVYLAKCYYDGYGTEDNYYLAFYWYQKSVENGSIIGQFYLGNCYEFGIGTEENEKKSVYFYKVAARNGNVIAKLYLANCYRLGKGIEKNEIKAFKYYETLAKQEISDAQLRLGDCYYYGIGTKIDKIQAKCWYEKATNNGNIIAKNILKRNYNIKTGIEMDKSKKIKFYKILFNKSLSRLGFYYFGKLLLKTNYEKSFYYFQKAAENGCKFAQYNLGGCYQLGDGVMKDLRKSFELYKKSAEQGYINAQSQLIYCYTFGYGTEIDRVKAFELARAIAEKGYIDVQYLLGQYYIYGEGVNKDENKAFELFRKFFKKNAKYLSSNKEIMINKEDFEYSKLFAKSLHINSYIKLGYCYNMGIGTEINKKKAFKYYKIAAENGDETALYNLGNCYLDEIGVEKDEKKAFEYYKKSADQEYLNAQFQLGYCYDEGIGTEVNKVKAFELYKIAAEKGNKTAQYNLGNCYMNKIGVEKDEKKAFEYYKKSADQGYLDAQFQLGYFYFNGIGTEANKIKAFELYSIAAKAGHNCARNCLGFLYDNGEGTDKSLAKAFYWFNKAAEDGSEAAQCNLGEYYELGNFVDKDEIKAFELYKKSAENGNINAKFQLGYCYVNGIGTEINKEKGFELYNDAAGSNFNDNFEEIVNDLDKINYWYHKAAENNNKYALYKLGEFYELGKGVWKNKVRAYEFYKKSANLGLVDAQYKLGYFYEKGFGTDMNKEKAFGLYKIAAEGGNIFAQKSLAYLYEQGEGTNKNLENSIYWYNKAVENGHLDVKENLSILLNK